MPLSMSMNESTRKRQFNVSLKATYYLPSSQTLLGSQKSLQKFEKGQ